jgi:hypothetical protein
MTDKNVMKVSGILILVILGAALAAVYFPEGPPVIHTHPGPLGPVLDNPPLNSPPHVLSSWLSPNLLVVAVLFGAVLTSGLHIGLVLLCFIVLLKVLKYLDILLERER